MADNTDAEVIRFCNEVIRPKCETKRNSHYENEAMVTYWNDIIKDKIANDPNEIIVDGRPDVTQLTGEDIHKVVAELGKDITAMKVTGVLSSIQKPCVRHLQVS